MRKKYEMRALIVSQCEAVLCDPAIVAVVVCAVILTIGFFVWNALS